MGVCARDPAVGRDCTVHPRRLGALHDLSNESFRNASIRLTFLQSIWLMNRAGKSLKKSLSLSR